MIDDEDELLQAPSVATAVIVWGPRGDFTVDHVAVNGLFLSVDSSVPSTEKRTDCTPEAAPAPVPKSSADVEIETLSPALTELPSTGAVDGNGRLGGIDLDGDRLHRRAAARRCRSRTTSRSWSARVRSGVCRRCLPSWESFRRP